MEVIRLVDIFKKFIQEQLSASEKAVFERICLNISSHTDDIEIKTKYKNYFTHLEELFVHHTVLGEIHILTSVVSSINHCDDVEYITECVKSTKAYPLVKYIVLPSERFHMSGTIISYTGEFLLICSNLFFICPFLSQDDCKQLSKDTSWALEMSYIIAKWSIYLKQHLNVFAENSNDFDTRKYLNFYKTKQDIIVEKTPIFSNKSRIYNPIGHSKRYISPYKTRCYA